jgi:hypothetical protein
MKKFGQCMPMVAVNMAQQMMNAPIRVNRPNKIKTPPLNSPSASAANHNHAGRNGNGASRVSVIHFDKPGPANVPNTFCEPCAIKTIPTASRSGNVDQIAEVAVSFFSTILCISVSRTRFDRCYSNRAPLFRLRAADQKEEQNFGKRAAWNG